MSSFLMELIEEREKILLELGFTGRKGDSKEYKNWASALKNITYVIDSERDQLDD